MRHLVLGAICLILSFPGETENLINQSPSLVFGYYHDQPMGPLVKALDNDEKCSGTRDPYEFFCLAEPILWGGDSWRVMLRHRDRKLKGVLLFSTEKVPYDEVLQKVGYDFIPAMISRGAQRGRKHFDMLEKMGPPPYTFKGEDESYAKDIANIGFATGDLSLLLLDSQDVETFGVKSLPDAQHRLNDKSRVVLYSLGKLATSVQFTIIGDSEFKRLLGKVYP